MILPRVDVTDGITFRVGPASRVPWPAGVLMTSGESRVWDDARWTYSTDMMARRNGYGPGRNGGVPLSWPGE